MVMPRARTVHAERAISGRRPAFPQGGVRSRALPIPAPGWPTEGLDISASTFQANEPAMIPVQGKAAIMAWEGYSSGPGNKIVVQKLVENGAESFAISRTFGN